MKYVVMIVFVAIMATFPAHANECVNKKTGIVNDKMCDEDNVDGTKTIADQISDGSINGDVDADGKAKDNTNKPAEQNWEDKGSEPTPGHKPSYPADTEKKLPSINEIVPSKTTGHTERKAKSIIKDIKKNTLISIDIHIPIYFNTEKEIIVTGRTTVNNHNETFTLTLIKRF